MPSYTLSQNSAAILRKTPFVVQNNSKLLEETVLFDSSKMQCKSNPQKLSRVSETKNDMDKLFDFNVQIQVH